MRFALAIGRVAFADASCALGQLDKASARAYYDRACYKHLRGGASKPEVLHDLETAIKYNDMMRKMAKLDPDLKDLHHDPHFKKLVNTETVRTTSEKVAASA